MLILLSPAKALDFKTPPHIETHTQPAFLKRSEALIKQLRKLSPADIANLMDLSDPLALLNFNRYADWSLPFTPENAKQAALAFDGDVYGGLDAWRLTLDELDWAQDHLVILSGLYGVLRPLDRLQPYRLEMGTRLAAPGAKDLYAYWGDRIALHLNRRQRGQDAPVVVNLASQEYVRAVDRRALKARVVDCVFEEGRARGWQVISFFAKRARGLMARFAVQQRIDQPAGLRNFAAEGYAFAAAVSTPERLVFRRAQNP